MGGFILKPNRTDLCLDIFILKLQSNASKSIMIYSYPITIGQEEDHMEEFSKNRQLILVIIFPSKVHLKMSK